MPSPHKEFIAVNARIRQVRSSEDVSSATQGKTTDAFQKEVSRERDQRLRVVITSRRKTGRIDLEAIRPAMHRAGAAGLTQLRSRRRAANPRVFPLPAG